MSVLQRAALALVLLPAAAQASGFYFGENGNRALAMGGAFAAQADDLSAVKHNPAGLSQLQGFHFLLDVTLLNHEVYFLRADPDGSSNNIEPVQNTAGVFPSPMVALGYGMPLGGRPFHVSLAAYPPPSVGRYQFPTPNYATRENDRGQTVYEQDPRRFAPQRFGVIENDVVVLFPTLAAAYEVHRTVSVGLSFQYVYTHFKFQQAVTSSLFTPQRMRDENPAFDSLVAVDQRGKPTFTGILGVHYKPTENLRLGASYRPPVPVHAEGTAVIELGEVPRQIATIEGDRATFSMTLPQELKVGAYFKPLQPLGVSAEVVYQGWQSVGAFVLDPEVQLTRAGADPEELEPFHIPKHWQHAWGGRLGVEWAFPFGLTARGGVLLEQSGIPEEHMHIDFLHFNRAFFTGGLEYGVGPVSVVVSGAFTPTQEKVITNSQVRQANTDPETPGAIIGNGTYRSGGWILAAGVRGSFGAGNRAQAAPVTEGELDP
jgi:long-subunit fatty acid transport protein